MKTYRERFLRTHHLAVPLIALFSGCAYFNTFYNATQFFRQAEQDIVTTTETELTDNTTELLNKTVARCNIVLSEYPESKFRAIPPRRILPVSGFGPSSVRRIS